MINAINNIIFKKNYNVGTYVTYVELELLVKMLLWFTLYGYKRFKF